MTCLHPVPDARQRQSDGRVRQMGQNVMVSLENVSLYGYDSMHKILIFESDVMELGEFAGAPEK